MCKKRSEPVRPSNDDNRENSNTNVGIINVSDQSIGDGLNAESIATYLIAIIVGIMVIKWVRKWCNRRQARNRNSMMMDMANAIPLQPPQQQPQPLALPPPAPVHQPMQPVVPIILHQGYKQPALEAIDSADRYAPDRMEKYRL